MQETLVESGVVSIKMHDYGWIFASHVADTDQTIRFNFIKSLLWCGL